MEKVCTVEMGGALWRWQGEEGGAVGARLEMGGAGKAAKGADGEEEKEGERGREERGYSWKWIKNMR
jgi:hypothetical protein